MTELLVQRTRVGCDRTTAFGHFTGRFGSWWPLATHSVGQSRAAECGIELYVGGRIWERTEGDVQHLWGHVLESEPPGSLSFTWHPGRSPDTAQTIHLRFRTVAPEGADPETEIVLKHGDWHVFGPAAEHAREQYRQGWRMVLGRFRCSVEAEQAGQGESSAGIIS